MPTYVSLDRPTTDEFEYEKPHYAGSGHGPFRPFGNALEDLTPVANLEHCNSAGTCWPASTRCAANWTRATPSGVWIASRRKALDMITSPRVRDAFDLSKEPRRMLDSYGRGQYPHQTFKTILYPWDGRKFLLARRLVEAGVRVVTLRAAEWDHRGSARWRHFPGPAPADAVVGPQPVR